jgi:cysteine desulfurase
VPAYFDHNASTPVETAVLEAMLPHLREQFGNPSSVHRYGRRARAALDSAREQVAALVNAHPSQVVFTSGGTEANNLAIKGVAARRAPGRLLIGATEHPSVTEAADSLVEAGWQVVRLPVDGAGCLQRATLAEQLRDPPALMSVMYANNETGTVQDIPAIAKIARAQGALLHTDAVQAAGKLPLDFDTCGVHLMSLSAHKIGGPKGVGALIVDKAVDMKPLLHGGGQERDRRSGTENVAGIVGFGVAATLVQERRAAYTLRVQRLREQLEQGLLGFEGVEILSADAERLPNTSCFTVHGMDGETLVLGLDRLGFAVSSGSACASGSTDPSPVLLAMGVERDMARGGMRVSFGWSNTEAEVEEFLRALGTVLAGGRQRRAAGA